MKPSGRINLIGGLLDLPILDRNGLYCGVVDDIELDEGGGSRPKVKHLLVGPGAYRGRLPVWAMALISRLAGTHVTRVPWEAIDRIDSSVRLGDTAAALGLQRSEDRFRAWIPRWGAM
jgi:sporulation protein YlmC with PRC-barrel domain